MAEVIKNKYLREFQRNLFPDNSFWMKGKSDSGADEFDVINIAQAASPVSSTFGKIQAGQANGANANSLTPIVRVNNTANYSIETFGTEPVALSLSDLETMTYNKRAELYQEHQDVIATDISNYAAIAWAQETANADLVVETTGTETRQNAVVGGLNAAVKRITKEDIINVKRLFHRMNLKGYSGRICALITPEQWEDILLIDNFVDYEKTGNESKLKEGIVGRLMGIDFLEPRHNEALGANVVYGATNNKKAYGAAMAADERSAAIFFHTGLVRYAKGRGYLYEDKKNPIYKADIMSADARFGATKSRTDGKGVVSLIEADATP